MYAMRLSKDGHSLLIGTKLKFENYHKLPFNVLGTGYPEKVESIRNLPKIER